MMSSVKIKVDKHLTTFSYMDDMQVYIPESSDGMMSASNTLVRVKTVFCFENEQLIDDSYCYDFKLIRVVNNTEQVLVDNDKDLLESYNFDLVFKTLRKMDVNLLNYDACLEVKSSMEVFENEFALNFEILPKVYPVKEEMKIFELDEVVDFFDEKKALLFFATNNWNELYKSFFVKYNSVFQEPKRKIFKKLSLTELLNGLVSEEDIVKILTDFVAKVEEQGRYTPLCIEGIESFVVALPEDLRRKVLQISKQSRSNLNLMRKYCPEKINWSEVLFSEMQDSDLDLMIKSKSMAETAEQKDFLRICMQKPELERKIVDNAYILAGNDLTIVVKSLKTVMAVELLRSVCNYITENLKEVYFSRLEDLLALEFKGLLKSDYNLMLKVFRKINANEDGINKAASAVLEVGLKAGVATEELERFLKEEQALGKKIELTTGKITTVYRKFNFLPGLKWLQEEEDRKIAEKLIEKRRIEEEHQKLLDIVRKNKTIRVRLERDICSTSLKVYDMNWSLIGKLKPDEDSVLDIEGVACHYLVDLETAKKGQVTVLEISVDKGDAGFIIGKKGVKVKELTEMLNKRGYKIRKIKVTTR